MKLITKFQQPDGSFFEMSLTPAESKALICIVKYMRGIPCRIEKILAFISQQESEEPMTQREEFEETQKRG